VAYADFVTAMMALFMVLWISAQDKEILIATSQYFQQPFNSPMDASSGVMDGNQTSTESINSDDSSSVTDLSLLNKLAQDFYKLLNLDETQEDRPIEVEVTNDGLRITMFNKSDYALFAPGSAEFTEWGRFAVQNLAWLIARNKFKIRIDGFIATGFEARSDYSGWELSSDRANAIRRGLHYYAVPADRFERVTGFADTVPLAGLKPEDQQNDRIEISLVIVPAVNPAPNPEASLPAVPPPSHQ
jgi:chemotaxis protein MotB